MRVALVHYWLVNMRGGEKVLESLCRLYPQADIYTHVVDKNKISPLLLKHNIYTSFIQKLPLSIKHYQKYLPLMPLALEQFDLRAYDLVISSEAGPAKGIIIKSDTPHICYCHSPMRYLWDFYQDYLEETNSLIRLLMRPIFYHLRQWDVTSANRVDHFIANSKTVARRIERIWRREAKVINPPVRVEEYNLIKRCPTPESPYLCLGQLVGYKRTDLAVKACTKSSRPLIVAGDGPDLERLKAMAGPTVSFAGRVTDEQAAELYAKCRALIFPGEEDFGMVPVEAQAAGCPVLAYGKGGALETVVPEQTGLFFAEQNVESVIDCLENFEQGSAFDPINLKNHAANFTEEHFQIQMQQEIKTVMQKVHG